MVRQEADTNSDRRVDVWINFQNGEKIEQLEDQGLTGKITARYTFKSGQVVAQEQLANVEPPPGTRPFAAVEDEVIKMAGVVNPRPEQHNTAAAQPQLSSGAQVQ